MHQIEKASEGEQSRLNTGPIVLRCVSWRVPMGEARKHHYVPVFYQKHFTNDNGLLFVYDRKRQTYQELHPRSICHQSDLYATKPTDGRPRDRRMETEILSDFDGKSASAIRELATLNAPGPETLAALAVFAALQFLRVPTNEVFMRSIYEATANDAMSIMFSTVERAQASMERYEQKTGKKLNVSAESMVDAVKRGGIEAKANEIPFLRSIGDHTGFMAQTLAGFKLQILISPPAVGFILSDNPFTTVPAPGDKRVGLANLGTFTYIPTTRNICLRYGMTGRDVFQRIEREDVRLINQNIAVNSGRLVMGPSQVQLESVVRRSGSASMDPTPRFTLDKIPDADGGILRKLSQLPRRQYFYPNL
jgi:hypothetical protein